MGRLKSVGKAAMRLILLITADSAITGTMAFATMIGTSTIAGQATDHRRTERRHRNQRKLAQRGVAALQAALRFVRRPVVAS